MRLARLVLLLAASLAAPAGADEPLRVSAAALGADGGLGARVADVLGGDGPSYTRVLAIEAPPAGGRIAGQVEVFEIDGEAWIELVAVQADGRRAVARTTDPGRAAPRLVGSAPPRSFALDAPADPGGAAPVHLELAVGMLGPGVVSLSALRFEAAQPAAAAPTRARRGPWLALGAAAATLGALALRRSARRATLARGGGGSQTSPAA